jgi:hypothetical protein
VSTAAFAGTDAGERRHATEVTMPLEGVHRGLRYLPTIEDDLLPRTAQVKNVVVELPRTTMGRWRKNDGTYALYLHGNSEVRGGR